ncbi:MAG TPA: cation diffusion facilitator family transporter [Caulobacteraceae bacterium]|nr:cation diffusion facilitator family transporter [Caulobacteraceae bacterium]
MSARRHHDHDDHHDHHDGGHAHASPGGWRFGVGMALNLAFVVVEAIFGFIGHSTALLADAGHNLSDVLGLALAGGAAWLAGLAGGRRHTYGFGKATVLAALANALLLVFACGAIVREAIGRFAAPETVAPGPIMVVASIGVAINFGTALLFASGRKHDINVRGAFLHMMGDAAVSAGVIVAGGVIAMTGKTWIDPAASLAIVVVIGISTWGLLKEAFNMAMDVAPAHLDIAEVRHLLQEQPGVSEVHDLHIWNLSTTEVALTAHLVRPQGIDESFLPSVRTALERAFGIGHVTLQIETKACPDCDGLHP